MTLKITVECDECGDEIEIDNLDNLMSELESADWKSEKVGPREFIHHCPNCAESSDD